MLARDKTLSFSFFFSPLSTPSLFLAGALVFLLNLAGTCVPPAAAWPPKPLRVESPKAAVDPERFFFFPLLAQRKKTDRLTSALSKKLTPASRARCMILVAARTSTWSPKVTQAPKERTETLGVCFFCCVLLVFFFV